MQRVAAIIVAAGRGERAGQAQGPKQYRQLAGKAVIAHTLDCFPASRFHHVVVVIHKDDADLLRQATSRDDIDIIAGGATRQDSVRLGLEALAAAKPDIVFIHDAARPFAEKTVENVLAAVNTRHGVLPALPVSDTLKRSRGDFVETTITREGLYGAQTPQAFPYAQILSAHRSAHASGRSDFTDDASIAEWCDIPVRVVAGAPENIKITYAADLDAAEARLRHMQNTARTVDMRVGNGYDVHRLVPGDHVTLCGVRIAHDMALSGHSDADVGLHALTDALLATCGAGDIGDHFPPSDPQWRGTASRIFLQHAAQLVAEKGGRISNADISLICEAPKIAPHRLAMRETVAGILGIHVDRVSVKATTNETIGFVGRKEGIAAIATACVMFGES